MSPSRNQQFIHHCIFVFKYNMTRCDRLFKSYMLNLSLKITFEDNGVPSIIDMSHKTHGSQVETNTPYKFSFCSHEKNKHMFHEKRW